MLTNIVDILQGSFSLIFVLVSLIIGLTILSKYRQFKSKIYVFVGLSWIGFAIPWTPDSINFLLLLFSNNELTPAIYFIIGNAFLPVFFLFWLKAFTDLLYKKSQKVILLVFTIISIIFEVLFFYLLFTDISAIGDLIGPFVVEFGLFVTGYLVLFILIVLVTGILFARKSLKSENPEVKLKGKLLITAFISFAVAAAFDSLLGSLLEKTDPLLPILVVVIRLVLISSAIEFYGGFILPRWMKEIFLKE